LQSDSQQSITFVYSKNLIMASEGIFISSVYCTSSIEGEIIR